MLQRKDLISLTETWLNKLKGAITQELGKDICEACRMVISTLSLLWAYFPSLDVEELTNEELTNEAKTEFKEALACLGAMIERETDSENCEFLVLYRRNIQIRLDALEVMPKEAAEVYSSSTEA